MQRAAAALRGEFDRLCKEHGLTAAQHDVLSALREEAGPLPSMALAERLAARVPDITRLIDRMETAGLVRRERDRQDRRVVRVRITPRGSALLSAVDGPAEALHKRQLRAIKRQELAALTDLLLRVAGW